MSVDGSVEIPRHDELRCPGEYASCEETWSENGMTTLRVFLVWYNNREVVPFLQAIHRQFAFYEKRGIDMFKRGINVPGLTLLYLFNDQPEKSYFTLFNDKNTDLHQLVKDGNVGGPSRIFQRYHEKRVTKIRHADYGDSARKCELIVGIDANVVADARYADGMVHSSTRRETCGPIRRSCTGRRLRNG